MEKLNQRICWTIILLSGFSFLLTAQYADIDRDGPGYGENCTTIIVGKLASTDGQ